MQIKFDCRLVSTLSSISFLLSMQQMQKMLIKERKSFYHNIEDKFNDPGMCL